MEFEQLAFVLPGSALSLRIDVHRNALVHIVDRSQDRLQILTQISIDQELAVQPAHHDRHDGNLRKVVLGNKARHFRERRVTEDHVQVAAVVSDEQAGPAARNVFPADDIKLNAQRKAHHPEGKLHVPEAKLLSEVRPLLLKQPLQSEIRNGDNHNESCKYNCNNCPNHNDLSYTFVYRFSQSRRQASSMSFCS